MTLFYHAPIIVRATQSPHGSLNCNFSVVAVRRSMQPLIIYTPSDPSEHQETYINFSARLLPSQDSKCISLRSLDEKLFSTSSRPRFVLCESVSSCAFLARHLKAVYISLK